MDVDDDPEGVEENELDNLDEEFVHPHLELEGVLMMPCKRSIFCCYALSSSLLAMSCSSHPLGI
jgi:hypothetical protein